MKTHKLTILVTAGMLTAGQAFACGFHDGSGSGAYGIQWRAYDSNSAIESPNPQSEVNAQPDALAKQAQKARPVFSRSASRAIASAKNRSTKTADKSIEDQESSDRKPE